MLDIHTTVFGFAESNLNWSHWQTRDRLHKLIKQIWPHSRLQYARCTEPWEGSYQPGGVMQCSTGKMSGRLRETGQDIQGRWAWQRFQGKQTNQFQIITAYRPCKTLGPTTTWSQQWRYLRSRGHTNPDPRHEFFKDLQTHIQQYQAMGDTILLMIDANTTIETSDLANFMTNTGLIDILASGHPDQADPPPTHTRGRRLDYLLGTPEVGRSVWRRGTLGSGEVIDADHFGLYVDLQEDVLFCDTTKEPTPPSLRGLHTRNAAQCLTYREELHKHLHTHRVFQRVATILPGSDTTSHISPQTLQDLQTQYNKIDRDITAAMLAAEQTIHKSRYGHPWSPALEAAGRRVTYWRNRQKAQQRYGDPYHMLRPSQIRPDPTAPHKPTGQYIKQQVKNAWLHLKLVQSSSTEHRQNFLEEQIMAATTTCSKSVQQIRKDILAKETTQTLFRKLKIHIKGETRSGLQQLEVPIQNATTNKVDWVTISDPVAIHQAIIQQNQKHFAQAADTPFVNGPLAELLPPFDQNDTSDRILAGTFDPMPQDAFPEVQHYIETLAIPAHTLDIPPIPTTITLKDYQAGFRLIREHTSSSPSGRHIGHYKAALPDDDLSRLHAHMLTIPFQYGFAPDRWCHSVQVMLEKDPGRPNIQRLRTIQLVEADMNLGLKIIWGRRMVHHAEDHGLLPSTQYGSRPGRSAISAVLLKVLSYDVVRQQRLNTCVFDNDAQGCYDRMIPSTAMIACRRLGLPKIPARTMLQVLNNMQYRVRTAHGISKTHYSNQDGWVLGTLQGSGASPSIWLAVSSILLMMISQISAGFSAQCPRHTYSHQRPGEAFVDDTDLWLVSPEDTPQRAASMTRIAQRWERGLYASGGALALHKCFWYGITWTWKHGVAQMEPISSNPEATIRLTSGKDMQLSTIQRVEVTNGRRTLGVRLAPDGNNQDELTYRLKQAKQLAHRITLAPLNRQEAYIAYNCIIRPSIEYPLGVTTFTRDQCNMLQRTFTSAILSKLGYSSKTSRHMIVFGPAKYGGIGLANLWTEQGLNHLKLLLGHLRQGDTLSKMLHITIDTHQLQLGRQAPIFTYPYSEVHGYAEKTWATKTWDFLADIEASITLGPQQWTWTAQRTNDTYLMDSVIQHRMASSSQLRQFNTCRMYLRVLSLADISDSSGRQIEDTYWLGHHHPRRLSLYQWPHQPRPPPAFWGTWRKLLAQVFTIGPRKKTLQQTRRLGAWNPGSPQHQKWLDQYDPLTKHIYCILPTQTQKFPPGIRGRHFLKPGHPTDTIPSTCTPITLIETTHIYQATSFTARLEMPQPPVVRAKTFQQHVETLPPHELAIMGHFTIPQHIDHIVTDLSNGTVCLATDGSVQNGRGSHGWVIYGKTSQITFHGHGSLPTSNRPTTMRTEALGHLAALYAIRALSDHYQVSSATQAHTAWAYIDNTGVITRCTQPIRHGIGLRLKPDWDIFEEIRQVRETIPLTILYSHVRSHQDNHVEYDKLPLAAQLNIQADEQATSQHQCGTCTTPLHQYPSFPSEQATLFLADRGIHSNLEIEVREATTAQNMRTYITQHAGWTDRIFHTIDWPAFADTLKRQTATHNTQLVKLQHDLWPTNRQKHRYDATIPPICPRCLQTEETTNHVLQCPSNMEDRLLAWKTARTRLVTLGTAPLITSLLETGISHWQQCLPTPVYPGTPPQTTDNIGQLIWTAYHEQEAIGWGQALRGRLSRNWQNAQTQYHQSKNGGNGHTNPWSQHTIHILWGFSLSLWHTRNAQIYGDTQEAQATKRKEHTRQRIQDAYTHPRNLRHQDQHLYCTSLENMLRKPVQVQDKWLYSLTIAHEACQREQEIQDTGQQLLTRFLVPDSRPRERYRPPPQPP